MIKTIIEHLITHHHNSAADIIAACVLTPHCTTKPYPSKNSSYSAEKIMEKGMKSTHRKYMVRLMAESKHDKVTLVE